MNDLPRFANIRDGLRKPVSQRVANAFGYFAITSLFAMAAMITAAIINYQ